MVEKRRIELTVNGKRYSGEVEPRVHLGDFLRHGLGLTGTHLGCEHGVCGACTIIVDGAAIRSCLMLAVQANGAIVETVEGLARADGLHPLQKAFTARHALQCGFCTSGVLMSLLAYLRKHPEADEAGIRGAISGNICRCTGYQSIVEAALDAAPSIGREGC
jgi:aerobic-type carbon monoxide dehydrogenase small subunit (CoxS/CutS family)